MIISKALRGMVIGVGGALVGAASAAAAQEAVLPPDTFECRVLGPENFLEPPPPLQLARGETAEATRALRRLETANKLADQPCPKSQIAYPLPLRGAAQKVYPNPKLVGVASQHDPQRMSASSATTYSPGYNWVSKSFDGYSQGATIEISIVKPDIDNWGFSNHSIAQLAMIGQEGTGDTVELGWRSDWTYGEQPRLFTFVNKDYYDSYGDPGGDCYNCHFIPVAGADYVPNQILVVDPEEPTTLKFGVRQFDGNWWVWVGDEWIGYLDGGFWPGGFTFAAHHQFYGEVYDNHLGETDMGNGEFGQSLDAAAMQHPTASYYKNGQYNTVNETLDPPPPGTAWSGSPMWTSAPNLYNYGQVANNGTTWKFGGPGTG